MEDFIHKNQSYMPINFKLYTIRVFMYELKISQKQIKINACKLLGGGNCVYEACEKILEYKNSPGQFFTLN